MMTALSGMVGTAALGLLGLFAPEPSEVHSATRDVRDCQALAQGYAAATDGGLVFVDADGQAGAPLTVFDGLPATRSYTVEPVLGQSAAEAFDTTGHAQFTPPRLP